MSHRPSTSAASGSSLKMMLNRMAVWSATQTAARPTPMSGGWLNLRPSVLVKHAPVGNLSPKPLHGMMSLCAGASRTTAPLAATGRGHDAPERHDVDARRPSMTRSAPPTASVATASMFIAGVRPERGQVNVRIVERFQASPRGCGTRDARPRRGRRACHTMLGWDLHRAREGAKPQSLPAITRCAPPPHRRTARCGRRPLGVLNQMLDCVMTPGTGSIVRQLRVLPHSPLVLWRGLAASNE